MEFAGPLPKTNTPKEEEGGLIFCSTEEGVKNIIKNRLAGRMLFVTDATALGAFRSCLPPRTICLVLDSDECLPLFLSSDDAAFVAAAGKTSTLVAARFFAEVRKIPCTLFPVSMTFDGVFEKFGEVRLHNTVGRVPLKEAEVCCDRDLMRASAGQAYMRLLLSRLALLEAKAMRCFGAEYGCEEAEERAYSALLPLKAKTFDSDTVALKNAEIRRCERNGMKRGEGVCLAERIGREGEEQAFFLLSALYSAFFERGKPCLRVPDYAARAKSANVLYSAQKIPTVQEFVRRVTGFERMKREAYRELNAFLSGQTHFRNNFYALTGRAVCGIRGLSALKCLPEHTSGLSAVIRDFGLMEWEEGQREDILLKSV